MIPRPIIETVTPALFLALFFHLKDLYAKIISKFSLYILGHKRETCSPWLIEFVATKANLQFLILFINSAPLINHRQT